MATSSSGFRKDDQRFKPALLPLQAWSLGCNVNHSEDGPAAWLVIEFAPRLSCYVLKVVEAPSDNSPLVEFKLDRAFESATVRAITCLSLA